MKYSIQRNLTSPRLSKSRTVDPTRRSFILQSMESFIDLDEDDSISVGDLQDAPHPAVIKPSMRRPGALTKDDRSTSTEVTTSLDDCSVTSFDLTEMDKPFSILPVSPYGEVLDFQEHYEEDDDEDSSIQSTHSLNFIAKPDLRKAVSIESVDIDDFLGMPDLRKTFVPPPMRRTSITVPMPLPTECPNRRSSVSFAEVAEVSFIDKLDATTDYDSLYYTDLELADFRHQAFLEQCGIADEDFDY